ncbi:MAG: ATP-binding protein [Gaiellales bacterium]
MTSTRISDPTTHARRTLPPRRARSTRTSSHALSRREHELVRAEGDRYKAWFHDTALQVLEYLATGGYGECDNDPGRMMSIAANAADDLRRVIDETAPEQASTKRASLADELHTTIDDARSLSSVCIRAEISETIDDVSPEIATEIAGVVREALNNIRKHAQASNVVVTCNNDADGFQLCVIDDGVGFDPRGIRESIGIRTSMRGRIERCGGTITISSMPSRGTVVHVTINTGLCRETEFVA